MRGKIFKAVAVLVMAAAGLWAWPGQAQMERRPGSFFIGDTDGDGIVAPRDVAGLQGKIIGIIASFPDIVPSNGDNLDLDNDNNIGPGDINKMMTWVLSNYSSFPARPTLVLPLNSHHTVFFGPSDSDSVAIEAQVFAGDTAHPLSGWGVIFTIDTNPPFCADAFLKGRLVHPIIGAGRDQYTAGAEVFEYTGPRSQGARAKVKLFITGCQSGDSVRITVRLPSDAEAGLSANRLPTAVNGATANFTKIVKPEGPPLVPIPSGCFLMGDPTGGCGQRPEENWICQYPMAPYTMQNSACFCPVHEVCISSFWLDRHEVTIGEYKECVSAGECEAPLIVRSATREHYYDAAEGQFDNYPVVGISWFDAENYCAWAGKRLPTEAEFEYAARSGRSDVLYTWGNTTDGCGGKENSEIITYCPGVTVLNDTTAAESYVPNLFGLYDMGGNVGEMADDYFYSDYYNYCINNTILWNPPGDYIEDPRYKVARGAAFGSDRWAQHVYYRYYIYNIYGGGDSVGFRCAYGGAY